MRSRLAAIPALVLVALAIWEIAATRRDAHEVPRDEAWAKAAAIVRAGYKPGDLIVFAPAWVDPIGRLFLGDLIPLAMAARMDGARYARIWELSIRDAIAPEAVGVEPKEIHDGDVKVLFYERAPAVVVADISDSANARVDLVEVAFEPHRCVVATVPAGTPVRVAFPNLPLGSELVGYVGIADVFTRRENREPVELVVEAAGKRIAAATAPIDEWVRFRAATTPGAADVTFVVSWTAATPQAPPKQVCIAAEARR